MMASVKTANVLADRATARDGSVVQGSSATLAGLRGENTAGTVVYQVSFNPTDSTQLCVVGSGIFKLFRYAEGMLKPFISQKMEARVSAYRIQHA